MPSEHQRQVLGSFVQHPWGLGVGGVGGLRLWGRFSVLYLHALQRLVDVLKAKVSKASTSCSCRFVLSAPHRKHGVATTIINKYNKYWKLSLVPEASFGPFGLRLYRSTIGPRGLHANPRGCCGLCSCLCWDPFLMASSACELENGSGRKSSARPSAASTLPATETVSPPLTQKKHPMAHEPQHLWRLRKFNN